MPKCAICIATYQRPLGLTRVIESLGRLDLRSCEALSLEVIVADNDSAKSACGLCVQLAPSCRWPLTYVCEPRRGIPFARNAVVRCALGRGAEYLAFVDDDEVPDPTWLKALWLAMTAFGADVVTGPSMPHFDGPIAGWLRTSGLFDGERHATGTLLKSAYSNNILMRADVFQRTGRLFDERFRLSGGEDTDFFRHSAQVGCTIVWSEDAIVHEWYSPSRARVTWLLKRAYRWGMVWGQRSYDREALRRGALRGLAKGTLWLPWALFQGRAASVKALQLIASGAGYLAARLGFRFDEYQRTHGD